MKWTKVTEGVCLLWRWRLVIRPDVPAADAADASTDWSSFMTAQGPDMESATETGLNGCNRPNCSHKQLVEVNPTTLSIRLLLLFFQIQLEKKKPKQKKKRKKKKKPNKKKLGPYLGNIPSEAMSKDLEVLKPINWTWMEWTQLMEADNQKAKVAEMQRLVCATKLHCHIFD